MWRPIPLVPAAFVSCLVACGAQTPSASHVQTIIDTLDISLLHEGDIATDPFARAMGSLTVLLPDPEHAGQTFALPHCTGIQIAPRYVLTAAHCNRTDYVFNKGRLALADDPSPLSVQVFGDVVRLAYDGAMIPTAHATETSENLLGGPVFQDATLDFAIFRLPAPLPDHFIKLDDASQDTRQLELLAYPNGVPLTKASGCAGQGAFDHGTLRHDCDSLTGSSGGLLVSRATQTPVAMQIKGPILNSGISYQRQGHFETAEEIATSRGCQRDQLPDDARYQECIRVKGLNGAVALQAVKESLTRQSPGLWSEIQGE